jgi:hypothetical protein
MSSKKKITYEQGMALDHGRSVARANQKRRVAAKQDAIKVQAERDKQTAKHDVAHAEGFGSWKNWEYDFDSMTETRVCRDCDRTETRKISF